MLLAMSITALSALASPRLALDSPSVDFGEVSAGGEVSELVDRVVLIEVRQAKLGMDY